MNEMPSNRRVDGARRWQSLMDMAEIGPGLRCGNNRQALTDADREGRDLFRSWCEDAGMIVGIDSMGNMFIRRAGKNSHALIGSQTTAKRFTCPRFTDDFKLAIVVKIATRSYRKTIHG